MIKKTIVLLLALCLAVVATACVSSNDPAKETTPVTDGETVESESADTSAETGEPDTDPADTQETEAVTEPETESETDAETVKETTHYVIPTDTKPNPPEKEPETDAPETDPAPDTSDDFQNAIRSLGIETVNGLSWVLFSSTDAPDGSRVVLTMVNKGNNTASVKTEYRYDPNTHELERKSSCEDMPVGNIEECLYVLLGDFEVFWR